MTLTDQQRAELKALAEDPFATFGSRTIRALLADLEEHKSEFAKLMQKHNALHINAHETRQQLAEAQADNAAMHSAAHQLAIEAECFYLDCKDMPTLSKWSEPMLKAISDVQALRWNGYIGQSALSAAIEAAVEPYKREAEKKAMLFNGCSRSHPHELMSPMCELRTEIARLTNLSENQRLELEKHKGTFSEELTDVRLINDTYNKVRKERDFAVDDLEYDLFAAGWKACAALSAKEAP